MKIEYPLYDCMRTHGEIKIYYNTNLHKYSLSHCVTSFPKYDEYPFTFSKDDLTNNGLRKILDDYQELMSDKLVSDYFYGSCTNICYSNISNKINCKAYKWMNIQDIRLDIGDKCNMSCEMCPYANGELSNQESEEALKYMFEYFFKSDFHIPLLQSSERNEATSYDWFFDYVKKLPEHSCDVFNVHTNGLIICTNRDLLDDLIYNSKINVKFNLSIDGITPETYYNIRHVDIFDKLIDTAVYLNNIGHLSAIFYVPQKNNEHEWNDIYDYFGKLGLDKLLCVTGDKLYYDNNNNNLNNVISKCESNPVNIKVI